MKDEMELLRQFAEEGSEEAFTELVRLRIDFVYAVALRVLGGDRHLAEDVAQSVFLDLARKAGSLDRGGSIVGWLHTSARFAAAKAVRTRMRRAQHQQEIHAMQHIASEGHEPNWEEIRPLLDDALGHLGEGDRAALLLRYFDGRSLAEVGARLGLGENSARMRVERALEKLRVQLSRRGIRSTGAALGAVLAAQPAIAAPAGLCTSVAGAALAGLGAGGSLPSVLGSVLEFMSTTKRMAGLAAVVVIGGFGLHLAAERRLVARIEAAELGAEWQLAALRAENAGLRPRRLPAVSAQAVPMTAPVLPISPDEQARATVDLITSGRLGRTLWTFSIPGLTGGIRDLAEVMALNETEATQLAAAAEEAQKDLGRALVAAAEVRRETDSIVVMVKETPAVAAVQKRLLESTASILGPQRFAAFQQLGAPAELEKFFQGFASPGTISITRSLEPASGAFTYRFSRTKANRGRQLLNGDRQKVAVELEHLDGVLPQDF